MTTMLMGHAGARRRTPRFAEISQTIGRVDRLVCARREKSLLRSGSNEALMGVGKGGENSSHGALIRISSFALLFFVDKERKKRIPQTQKKKDQIGKKGT